MSILSEFREFIARGNVADLAVGVIIGGAFGKIVTALVEDVVMPPIGLLMSGVDFSLMNWMMVFRKAPYWMATISSTLVAGLSALSTRFMWEKSTPLISRPIGGMTTSSTSPVTILPKAPPMMTPTARSTTLPRAMNSRNSLRMDMVSPLGMLLGSDDLSRRR